MPEHLESREEGTREFPDSDTGLSKQHATGPPAPRAPDTLLLARLSLAGHNSNTEPRQALETQGGPLDDHRPSAELGPSLPCGEF